MQLRTKEKIDKVADITVHIGSAKQFKCGNIVSLRITSNQK